MEPPRDFNDAQERTRLATERNRLAMERTFSAWVRTGLAGFGGGFAILRFVTFANAEHQMILQGIAKLLMFWGIGVFIYALSAYVRGCRRLYPKSPEAAYSLCGVSILTYSIVLLCLALVALTFIAGGVHAAIRFPK